MSTSYETRSEPQSSPQAVPSYTSELAAFHRAFEAELSAVVNALPITPAMRVVDVGCGDGFYTGLLAQRLSRPGGVVGFDKNQAMLTRASQDPRLSGANCNVELIAGDIADLPEQCRDFDFVWCAQSLYSLPEPVDALRHMRRAVREGGIVAVLENDTLHQVLLPWPCELELAIRAAEYAARSRQSHRPNKFYVGRRLPAVLAAAGFEPLGFQTQSIDRQAPLDKDLESFLRKYLQDLAERVHPFLAAPLQHELAGLIDPHASACLLDQPHFTMSWLNVLAWGRRPTN
jgi:SAM-dependent methyltransferase